MKRLREGRHWSQEWAAHEIGVSVKTVRSWEKGGAIKWSNAKRAASVYGVDPESIAVREDDADPYVSPDGVELQEAVSALDGKMDRLLGQIAALAAEVGKVQQALQVQPTSKRRAGRHSGSKDS